MLFICGCGECSYDLRFLLHLWLWGRRINTKSEWIDIVCIATHGIILKRDESIICDIGLI